MHKMAAMIMVDPAKARREILVAFRNAGASRGDAAVNLGATRNTFARWVEALGLVDELAEVEARAVKQGWHHGRVGGRPMGSTKK